MADAFLYGRDPATGNPIAVSVNSAGAIATTGGSGGGGGGGDASAANQITQIARETAIAASVASIDGKVKNTGAGSPIGIVAIEASDGVMVPVDSLAQTMGYDGAGNLASVSVVWGGLTYVQTLTYTSGKLSGVSRWVKQ